MKIPAVPEKMDGLAPVGPDADFLRSAEDFAALQQEHRNALAAGNCKDIVSWLQCRERAFRNLVLMVEKVVADGGRDTQYSIRARDIIGKLLADEEALQSLVMARSLEVREQLLAMRKGKEALQGYRMNKGQAPRPSYLSSRT